MRRWLVSRLVPHLPAHPWLLRVAMWVSLDETEEALERERVRLQHELLTLKQLANDLENT